MTKIAAEFSYTKKKFEQDKQFAAKDFIAYWSQVAKEELHWDKMFTHTLQGSFAEGSIKWFADGKLNPTYNCLDRHVQNGGGQKIAYYFESEDGKQKDQITYAELLNQVNLYCHILMNYGAHKGDRVVLYMPLGIEVIALMLASARMGLVHSVVFAGFSAHALLSRIEDSLPQFIFTSDHFYRGQKEVPLLAIFKEAQKEFSSDVKKHLKAMFVDQHLRHHAYDKLSEVLTQSADLIFLPELRQKWKEKLLPHTHLNDGVIDFPYVPLDAEDPLFILYTSGSTGKPKGLVHTIGGYLTSVSSTFKKVFDHRPQQDRYWCTADVGWITGHSYVVYGPLLNGATSVLYDGAPASPDWGRFWSMIEEYQVTLFYTAPTAIRSFMSQGEAWLKKYDLSSLRLLGTVGEPINPAAWEWFHREVGSGRCSIVDTYWQTETGSIMMTPLPGVHQAKPGFAMEALPGIFTEVKGDEKALVITQPWPSLARTIYGDHQRYIETYFRAYPGCYFTGDGVEVDKDQHIRITGRIDDVLNVSGHRIGTAEVESALMRYAGTAEAAVIAVEDEIKGQAIVCFVKVKENTNRDQQKVKDLAHLLTQVVVDEIGKFARPKSIFIVPDLPKTRSGKIMRRLLRKIAEGVREVKELGDLSTLAAPEVIQQIIKTVSSNN